MKNEMQSINAKFNQINNKYIKQLYKVLLNLSNCSEIVNVNTITYISNDLDYIAVNYFMQIADGEYQNQCKLGYKISDIDAINILTTRINNSL